jgi:hypothetical protein
MTQIWHIFRKDLRHHWPYVLLPVLVSMLLHLWSPLSLFVPSIANNDAWVTLLILLQPVASLLLVARLVQDEALPGTTQFWISRPYDWRCLVAAKGLFLLLLIHGPSLLVQLGGLARNGFSPWSHLSSVLAQQLAVFFTLILAGWAIAALTTHLAQFLLVFLCGFLALMFSFQLLPLRFPSGLDWMMDFLRYGLGFGVAALLIWWQYRRRARLGAYLIAGVGFVLVLLVPAIVSASRAIAWQELLSPSAVAPALSVQLDLSQQQAKITDFPTDTNNVYVRLPLAMTGFDDRDILVHRGEILLVTPQGERIPAWLHNIDKVPIGQGSQAWRQVLLVNRRELARIKSPVRIESKVVLSTYRRVASVELPLSPEPRWIEGIGWCVAGEWKGSVGLRVRCRHTTDNRDRITVDPVYQPGSSGWEYLTPMPESGGLGPRIQFAPVSVATSWARNFRGIRSFRLHRLTYEYTGPFTWTLDEVPLTDLVVEGTGRQ